MTWLGTGWSRLKRDRVLCCSLEDGYERVGEGEASLSQLDAALCLHLQVFIKSLLPCARRANRHGHWPLGTCSTVQPGIRRIRYELLN